MPSVQVGLVSGGQLLISGNPWSGRGPQVPQGGIQFRWDRTAQGNLYIGLSGGLTVNSGGFSISGGFAHSGLLDGMQLGPGDTHWIPKIAVGASGTFNIFGSPDAVASGNRLYYEVYSILLPVGLVLLANTASFFA